MMYFVKIKGLETIPLVTNEDGAREVIKSFDLPESALENGFSNEIISIVRSDNDSLDDAQKENLKLIYDQKFKEIMSFGVYNKKTIPTLTVELISFMPYNLFCGARSDGLISNYLKFGNTI